MPGLSEGANLTIALFLILGIGYLIYQIDRRVKKDGTLIKRDGSSKSRVYALIIGLLIGGFVSLEWIVGIRIYLLLLLSIALIGYGFGFDHLLEVFQPKKTRIEINEIPGLECMTRDEVKMQIQAGARFVVFEFCISFLYRSVNRSSKVYFIKPHESYFDKSIGYSAIAVIFGWLNPLNLYKILRTNLSGGRNVTQEVLELYDNPNATL